MRREGEKKGEVEVDSCLGEGGLKDICRLVSCGELMWRSFSGEGSDFSVSEQSVRSLSVKFGGLECVLFLVVGWGVLHLSGEEGVIRGRVCCCTGGERQAAG